MWFLFSFLSAFTQATYQAVSKRFIKNLSPYILSSGNFFVAFPFLIGYVLLKGWPHLNNEFFIALFATAFLNVIASIFFLKALRNVDLSVASPIIALTPMFSLFTSYFILGEAPKILGAAGVAIIVFGLIVITHKHQKKDDFAIEAETKKQKRGLIFLFLTAFIYSISSNYDKLVSVNSTPLFATFSTLALMGFVMLVIAISKKEYKVLSDENNFWKLIILGLIYVAAAFVWFAALSRGLVVYSIAIKRLSVLIGIGYGFFWFKEKNIQQKLAGAAIILIGLVFIIFFK